MKISLKNSFWYHLLLQSIINTCVFSFINLTLIVFAQEIYTKMLTEKSVSTCEAL